MPQTQFQNWFKPLEFIRRDEQRVVLGVPSRFHEEWLRSHYAEQISHVLRTQVGQSVQLEFEILAGEDRVEGPAEPAFAPTVFAAPAPAPAPGRPNLRIVESPAPGDLPSEEVDFDLCNTPSFPNPFVELDSNQVAYRCARLFAEGGTLQFNPLILFAGVGMGKTHLLSEVGRWVRQLYPGARVRYTNGEGFANEFFEALRGNPQDIVAFKRKYRDHTDCLLFDNLEGLCKKTKSQEELLHIFNEISARGGKIAFATSIPPHRLESIIEPLKSRLLAGVLAEVKYPSFQEKVTLLQRSCSHYGIAVDSPVLRTLADQGQKDIRELVGTLVRLHLQAKISARPLDETFLAREGVSTEPRRETISLEEIVTLVEHNYGVCRTELVSKSRKGATAWARQVAMYLARQYTLLPLEQIGKYFGRDHATVIHAFQKVQESVENEPPRRFEVEFLKKKLQGRSARHGNPV